MRVASWVSRFLVAMLVLTVAPLASADETQAAGVARIYWISGDEHEHGEEEHADHENEDGDNEDGDNEDEGDVHHHDHNEFVVDSIDIEVDPENAGEFAEIIGSLEGRLAGQHRRWVTQGQIPPFMIGVIGEPVNETLKRHLRLESGVVITRVVEGSPAAEAGLDEHDIIVSIDGQSVNEMQDFFSPLRKSDGNEVKLKLVREGESQELALTPAERPMPEANARFTRRSSRGNRREGFTILNPGVILKDLGQNLGGDIRIEMSHEGDGPARVKVQRDGQVWEATEDQLEELPPEIRRLLVRQNRNARLLRLTDKDREAADWIPFNGGEMSIRIIGRDNEEEVEVDRAAEHDNEQEEEEEEVELEVGDDIREQLERLQQQLNEISEVLEKVAK